MNNIMTKITVGIFALLAMATIFVLFVARDEPDRLPAEEANFAARSVENGALLFEANCVGCHGVQGKGIPGVAPSINSPEFFTTRLQEVGYVGSLRSFIEGTVNAGRPVGSGEYSAKMATWGQEYGGPLRPDQIHDVASFILNWETSAVAGEPVAARWLATPHRSRSARQPTQPRAAPAVTASRAAPGWSAPTWAAWPRAPGLPCLGSRPRNTSGNPSSSPTPTSCPSARTAPVRPT